MTGTAVLLLEGLSDFTGAAGAAFTIDLGVTTAEGVFWRVVLVAAGVLGVNF